MKEKIYSTYMGDIHYWVNTGVESEVTLVFLPGLTADHRLFGKQLAFFHDKYACLVWDAPEQGASWPFGIEYDLFDKAKWVDEILETEGLKNPIIIGQSMGGYVGQAYAQMFPEKLAGFVSIDSAPLQRQYVTALEIWLLKRMEPVYRYWPWKSLLQLGTDGVATSRFGRKLMKKMMMEYDGEQARYARVAGHGYQMLAEAMEADLPYEIKCPALLICGEKDHAGSCIRYNKQWHKKTGLPIKWIKDAGHNSNTDKPEQINRLILDMVVEVCQKLS